MSVVIPFYNASTTIERALDSIAAQTTPVDEVIVVSDSSDALELEKLREIATKYTNVVVIDQEVNGGPSVARNVGVAATKNDYVAFLDSDDHWLPEKMEVCLRKMKELDVGFVGHNNFIGDVKKETFCDRLRFDKEYMMAKIDLYLSTSQFAPSTVVFNKNKIKIFFDETIRRSEDYRLWGELIFSGSSLCKIKDFLSVRDDPHINGRGLSGNVNKLLCAHLETVKYFRSKGYVTSLGCFFLGVFLRLKYLRHRV